MARHLVFRILAVPFFLLGLIGLLGTAELGFTVVLMPIGYGIWLLGDRELGSGKNKHLEFITICFVLLAGSLQFWPPAFVARAMGFYLTYALACCGIAGLGFYALPLKLKAASRLSLRVAVTGSFVFVVALLNAVNGAFSSNDLQFVEQPVDEKYIHQHNGRMPTEYGLRYHGEAVFFNDRPFEVGGNVSVSKELYEKIQIGKSVVRVGYRNGRLGILLVAREKFVIE